MSLRTILPLGPQEPTVGPKGGKFRGLLGVGRTIQNGETRTGGKEGGMGQTLPSAVVTEISPVDRNVCPSVARKTPQKPARTTSQTSAENGTMLVFG